jgi:hypothetical protein
MLSEVQKRGVIITKPSTSDMFLVQGKISACGTPWSPITFIGSGNFFYAFGSAEIPAYVAS